jgi:hypothetical protein
MMLAKSLKSLQLRLNSFIPQLGLGVPTVTAMAYSKARRKLKHTAFESLNQLAVVATMYENGDYQTKTGLRILAVDGSRLFLPENPETIAHFGTMGYKNTRLHVSGEHCCARSSVLYDVLNKVSLHATLSPIKSNEALLAEAHLPYIRTGDLVVYDRFYASYRMLAIMQHSPGDCLIRCSRSSFTAARKLFDGTGPDDQIVTLQPNSRTDLSFGDYTLPSSLTIRLIRVRLSTGEYEVLASTLLDMQRYPTELFAELYHCRWGVETFYGKLKTRLDLENFSGVSIEAALQDFHVTVLLTGIETILSEDSETWLHAQTGGHPKQVNKAVSFNIIKERAFVLFLSDQPADEVLSQLTELFKTNPITVRPQRHSPRGKRSPSVQRNFLRWKRKIVF